MQWFVDLSKVGQLCIERLKRDNVKVQSGSNGRLFILLNKPRRLDQLTSLISQMQKRPDWCISRQRTWGVPIPAVLNKSTNMVVTSAEFIKSTAYLFEKVGCDSWWQKDVNYFLNKDVSFIRFYKQQKLVF
jgi:isoleucyl-tRNA synthetase